MKTSKTILIFPLIFLALIALILIAYLVIQNNRLTAAIISVPTLTSIPTPIVTTVPSVLPSITAVIPTINNNLASTDEATNITGQKKYTSYHLGISFLYSSQNNDVTYKVKETANKIYLYDAQFNSSQGQYLEMFSKDPSVTLPQALETQFLTGSFKDSCEITTASPYIYNKIYPQNYVTANIKVNGTYDDLEQLSQKLDNCPEIYTASNGLSYFLMDTNHPNKFFFVSIGQYGISSGNKQDQGWQDTLQFF